MIWEDGEGFTVVVDDKSVTVNWIDPCAEQLFVYMKDFAGPDSAAIVADKLVDLFKDMVDLTDLAVANVRRFSVLLVAIMGRELTTVELK